LTPRATDPKDSLINYERTRRIIICINPAHETIRFVTNQVGDLECPICRNLMVTEIRPAIEIVDLE
jgi:hypothetical protein